MIKEITLISFTDGHEVSKYDNSYSLDDIQHEIDANGYEWVTMHNIKGHVFITVIEK